MGDLVCVCGSCRPLDSVVATVFPVSALHFQLMSLEFQSSECLDECLLLHSEGLLGSLHFGIASSW